MSPLGYIVITIEQYEWLFWASVLALVISTVNLVARVKAHPQWKDGFSGEIVRAVRISGEDKDYFIRGTSEAPIKQVLLDDWPFSEHKHSSVWHVVDERGNDITVQPLSSIDGTASVVIEEDKE